MLNLNNEKIHQLFYMETLHTNSTVFEIPENESSHILKSLRKKSGDILYLTNGHGYVFKTQIDKVQKKSIIISTIDHTFVEKTKQEIWLAMGLIRPQLFDLVIEKATELGVSKIIPFASQYVERQVNKPERWKKISITAIKQSIQFYLPEILSPISLYELKKHFNELLPPNRLLAKDSKSKTKISSLSLMPNSPILLVIGPEGGFSKEEFDFFSDNHFKNIMLATTRLRAETGAITGLAQLQLIC